MKISELKYVHIERCYQLDKEFNVLKSSEWGIHGQSKHIDSTPKHNFIDDEIDNEIIQFYLDNNYKQVPVHSKFYPLGFYKRTKVEYFEWKWIDTFDYTNEYQEHWCIYKKDKIDF